jgi:hypothetical protein
MKLVLLGGVDKSKHFNRFWPSKAAGPPPGTPADAKGRLRTRLLQVMVKDAGEWKIAVYHNVDIKPGVTAQEPE